MMREHSKMGRLIGDTALRTNVSKKVAVNRACRQRRTGRRQPHLGESRRNGGKERPPLGLHNRTE